MNPDKYEPWWATLSPDEKEAVFAVDSVLPDWLVASLRSADIMMAPIELPDGSSGFLMSTRFRAWRDEKRLQTSS